MRSWRWLQQKGNLGTLEKCDYVSHYTVGNNANRAVTFFLRRGHRVYQIVRSATRPIPRRGFANRVELAPNRFRP